MDKIIKGSAMNIAPNENEPATQGDLNAILRRTAGWMDRIDDEADARHAEIAELRGDIRALLMAGASVVAVQFGIVALVLLT